MRYRVLRPRESPCPNSSGDGQMRLGVKCARIACSTGDPASTPRAWRNRAALRVRISSSRESASSGPVLAPHSVSNPQALSSRNTPGPGVASCIQTAAGIGTLPAPHQRSPGAIPDEPPLPTSWKPGAHRTTTACVRFACTAGASPTTPVSISQCTGARSRFARSVVAPVSTWTAGPSSTTPTIRYMSPPRASRPSAAPAPPAISPYPVSTGMGTAGSVFGGSLSSPAPALTYPHGASNLEGCRTWPRTLLRPLRAPP